MKRTRNSTEHIVTKLPESEAMLADRCRSYPLPRNRRPLPREVLLCTPTPSTRTHAAQRQQPASQRSKKPITSSPSTEPSLLKSLGHAAEKFTVSV